MPQPEREIEPIRSANSFVRTFWAATFIIVVLYLAVLLVETFLRVRLPWAMWTWPESPFMVDMLKLNQHLPVYASPADANSFVYSPGLEYLTYALLRPFGLFLDIRCCRMVSVGLGMLAALAGTRLILNLLRDGPAAEKKIRGMGFVTWGCFWLVLSTNILSDTPHPDNLHILHATAVFALCFASLKNGRFGGAIMTMFVAGLGVFTKQTEALCFLGVAVIYALYNPWGKVRWLLLVLIGAVVMGISLSLVWLPHYARYYTFEVLRHQHIDLKKLGLLAADMFSKTQLLITFPALVGLIYFWRVGGIHRKFLVCWLVIGACCAGPNILAYIKVWGLPNNLVIFKFWKTLLAWPMFLLLLRSPLVAREQTGAPPDQSFGVAGSLAVQVVTLIFLLALIPLKPLPGAHLIQGCQAVDAAVAGDFRNAKKVLVSTTPSYLMHCGSLEIPKDQANSVLELDGAKQGPALDGVKGRFAAKFYDRIYLFRRDWYGPEILAELDRNYTIDSTIQGSGGGIMPDCVVMSPKR